MFERLLLVVMFMFSMSSWFVPGTFPACLIVSVHVFVF